MRTPVYRMLLLTLCMVLTAPRAADAGLLSWLSQLSGPGPFWGIDVGVCVKPFILPADKNKPNPSPDGPRGRQALYFSCPGARLDQRHVSWNVNFGGAIAENNPLDYGDTGRQRQSTAVRLLQVGSSLDYTLHPVLDLGAGAGVFYFAGPRFDNFLRAYVEPVRVSVRPLIWSERHLASDQIDRRGWLRVSAAWTILLGEIDGATFGAPLDPFHEENESILSLGLSIDVVRLLRNFDRD